MSIAKKTMISPTRTFARDLEKKFNPAIKALSTSVRNTGPVTNDFVGYKIPAGSLTDDKGRRWQYQVHALCVPSKFIKKDEIVPIIRPWAIGVRIKAYLQYLINWANKN
jgi:hypothetical protein